jgi:glycosyltransferase involved in cell wall biosynthesis
MLAPGCEGISVPVASTAIPGLSVVIPAHNSEAVIRRTMSRWRERLADTDSEIVIVENGSTDSTLAVAREFADPSGSPRIAIIQSEKGMGNALRAGIAFSSGARILLSADDLPFGFDDLDQADLISGVPDLVIGSKAHANSQVERSPFRRLSTFGYRSMRRLVLGSRVGDSQGTILANGAWLRMWAPRFDDGGFLFTTQLCWAAELQSKSIVEVPVRLSGEHAPKGSTVRPSDVWRMGSGLLRLRRERSLLSSAQGGPG